MNDSEMHYNRLFLQVLVKSYYIIRMRINSVSTLVFGEREQERLCQHFQEGKKYTKRHDSATLLRLESSQFEIGRLCLVLSHCLS